METPKRQHLQDIYATDETARDDFTPQVSSHILEERKREIRRHQFTSFMMGTVILTLALALVFVVVKEYMNIQSESTAPDVITQEYIPRYSLPTEAQWVLDVDDARSFANPQWNGEGERPFNAYWIKKASYNIILGEQAYQFKEYGEAAEYFENVLEILPNLESIKVPLGLAYFQLEEFDKAIVLLKDAPEADLTHDILNNLGAACIGAKAYEDAENYLKRSLEKKPDYAEALKNLGSLYVKQEREADAIRAYEQYMDQRPNDTDTRYTFALYLTKVGSWELAGDQLRILTEEITNVPTLYRLLAQVEVKLGNDKAAIEALQRATQLTDPNLAIGWMNEKEFDRLRENEDFQAQIKSIEKR